MIRMNDFRADSEAQVRAQVEAAERVIRSGWYVLGEEVRSFETEWASRCRTSAAVGVGNGLDAIEIGLRAIGVGAGDEVITTPMTAFATVLGIQRAGATPVLADIDLDTALLDPDSVARCVTGRTKAILLVHLYGQVRDMERWKAFCTERGLLLLEDCAQAHLARSGEQVAGGFGTWGAYSFYPTKNLGAPGDAGALVTNDAAIAERARMLRNYGQATRYEHPLPGLNSRLDEMQAAILRAKLAWLEASTNRRREIVGRYFADIRNPAVQLLAAPRQAENHVYHLFVMRCAQRDGLMAHLREQGVESIIHYPVPAHRQPPAQALARDPKGLARTEQHAQTCLSIPCHPNMTDEQVEAVVQAVNAFRG